MHLLLEASAGVARTIPEGETFILVDEEGFGADFSRARYECVLDNRRLVVFDPRRAHHN